MNFYRWIRTLSLAVAVAAASAVCFSQAAAQTKEIYNEKADARAEVKEALKKAKAEHKRVILVFGANWCFDCHVLDAAFHRSDLAPVLAANYEVVHVDIGRGEKNQDLMRQYEVPMKRGIPGLAVLDADGKLVYSQKNGEFENARALAPEDFLAFLNKWKPGAQSR
jgi:thiol:disulfide interchange protein